MGVLDSSMVFFLPLGIDFVVILLAARTPELFWLYAILATIGSVIGGAGTFWIGRKVGEHGLSRLVKASRLARVQDARWKERGRPNRRPGHHSTAISVHRVCADERRLARERVDVLRHAGGCSRVAIHGRRRPGRVLRTSAARVDAVDDVHCSGRHPGRGRDRRNNRVGGGRLPEHAPRPSAGSDRVRRRVAGQTGGLTPV